MRYDLGATLVVCTAVDWTGNVASCTFSITVVDVEPPIINCPSNIVALYPDDGSKQVAVTWLYNAYDNVGIAVANCTSPNGTLFTSATNNVNCSAWDAAGNSRTCAFSISLIDRTAPNTVCPASITIPAAAGTSSATVVWAPPVGSDNVAVQSVTCNRSVPATTFPLGVTAITCTTTDTSYLSSTCAFFVTVVDTQAPTVTCPSGPGHIINVTSGNAVYSWTYVAPTDNVGVSSAFATLNGASLNVTTPSVYTSFPPGVNIVQIVATDAAGNLAQCSFVVNVVTYVIEMFTTVAPGDTTPAPAPYPDANPPVIYGCPTLPILANTTTDTATAQVMLPYLTTYDVLSVTTNITSYPAGFTNGSLFPIGGTLVNFAAKDSAGHTALCAMVCRFRICVGKSVGLGQNLRLFFFFSSFFFFSPVFTFFAYHSP